MLFKRIIIDQLCRLLRSRIVFPVEDFCILLSSHLWNTERFFTYFCEVGQRSIARSKIYLFGVLIEPLQRGFKVRCLRHDVHCVYLHLNLNPCQPSDLKFTIWNRLNAARSSFPCDRRCSKSLHRGPQLQFYSGIIIYVFILCKHEC